MNFSFITKTIPVLALLFGVAIATSTAMMSVCSILLMLSALFIPNFKAELKHALANRFVRTSVLFFGLFVLGCLWSNAEYTARLKMLARLIAFGGAPLLFMALAQGNSANVLLKGFVFGALLSAACSFLAYAFKHPILQGQSDGATAGALFKWTVFRGHLLHDAFLAIATSMLLASLVFIPRLTLGHKVMLLAAYGLCMVDSMFLVQGRTGQVMFIVTNSAVLVYRFKLKGMLYAVLAGAILLPLLIWSAPALKNGLAEYKEEQSQLQQGNYNTSAGLRQQFHANSLALIKQRPLFGYGTGSFANNYAHQVAGTNFIRTKNPHGDLFLIGVELGLSGIIAFGGLLLANCRDLFRPGDALTACYGVTLLCGYLIALTQNSFFMDNVSGLAYLLLMLSILIQKSPVK